MLLEDFQSFGFSAILSLPQTPMISNFCCFVHAGFEFVHAGFEWVLSLPCFMADIPLICLRHLGDGFAAPLV